MAKYYTEILQKIKQMGRDVINHVPNYSDFDLTDYNMDIIIDRTIRFHEKDGTLPTAKDLARVTRYNNEAYIRPVLHKIAEESGGEYLCVLSLGHLLKYFGKKKGWRTELPYSLNVATNSALEERRGSINITKSIENPELRRLPRFVLCPAKKTDIETGEKKLVFERPFASFFDQFEREKLLNSK